MEYKLRYMELALRDMADIKAYLTGFYPESWQCFEAELKDGISALGSMPYRCETCQRHTANRRLAVDDYLVFYKVSESEKVVHIYHILHGARDIQRFLNT